MIRICIGSSCFARGNEENVRITEKFLADRKLSDDVDVDLEGCLCLGKCQSGPIVEIDGVCHTNVTGGVMLDLLNRLFPEENK
ncbi:MAG: (2Fe-2S) ferredoxin domain-containing protein [Victivallaceae bacterium]|nr:(2Fe-2S) ferredoxin domain-containing protein [Victivallaceae bacterium]